MGIRNLGSLEVFVALADTQSFTEAAKRLGMTTSAASQALRALEEELAVSLISRKSRPVMLTGAGVICSTVREHCCGMLESWKRRLRHLRQSSRFCGLGWLRA